MRSLYGWASEQKKTKKKTCKIENKNQTINDSIDKEMNVFGKAGWSCSA